MDDALFPQYSAEGRDLIRKAYDVAEKALAGETRSNGTPFFGHPLAVAKIAAYEIGLPAECVAAVFLHEATRGGKVDLDIHSLKLDESVYTMVDGLNKISTIKPKDTRLEAENYKKLIIQYSADPRVTVLKLADRLEVMRFLAIFPKADRERKVLETLMLYIPLAHQLGLYNMKREMEDIYLSYAEPEQYRLITNKLKATQKDREKLMAEFIEPLKVKLSEAGIQYKLKIRTKAAYSIWAKMVKQKVPFEGVFDVFAIRFIIDCPDDIKLERELCWKVFSFVTEEYEQDTKRLRDWVTTPKPNGYESLHITVKNRDGAYVEVQIRTRRMDEIAENGFASHWSYKGIKREETLDRWLTSVRYALEHPDTGNPEDLPQPPSREIFVFTPTGELRILPAGASVLDFAFSIHTNIGTRCVGGKVGGKPVPIKEKLRTGDVVEILTAKNQRPAPDWINFVVTTKARQKIKQALSEGEQKLASAGRELLERRLKNWKLEFRDEMLTEMMKKRKITSVNAFFAAVGNGDIDAAVDMFTNAAEVAGEGSNVAKDAMKQISNCYLKKAVACQKAKDNRGCMENAQKSAQAMDSPNAQKLIGVSALNLKQYDTAIGAFEAYLALAPNAKDNAQIIYQLATAYEGRKDRAKACSYYKQILNDPKFGPVAKYKVEEELKCNQ